MGLNSFKKNDMIEFMDKNKIIGLTQEVKERQAQGGWSMTLPHPANTSTSKSLNEMFLPF